MADDVYRRFLIACLRGRWDPAGLDAARASAAQPGFDWAELQARAVRGGVAQLLYLTLRDQALLPDDLAAELRMIYFQTARRNLLVFQDLAEVLGRLDGAGIPVIVLKGAALAEVVYHNLAVRPMCDVDLLVQREDAPRAMALLTELGYIGGERERRAGDTLAYENEVMLRKSIGALDILLEIHWSLFDSPHYQQVLTLDWFWNSSRTVELEGTRARVLGPEALLLHLSGHLLLHHGSDELRLLWLHDIAETIARGAGEINWGELIVRARAFDLVLPLREAIRRVYGPWMVPVPEPVVERLRSLRPSAAEARVFSWLTDAGRSPAQRLVTDLATMPDWRSRLRFALHNVFPSPAYMVKRYGIHPRWLVPVYYPYRWFLGISEWLARLR